MDVVFANIINMSAGVCDICACILQFVELRSENNEIGRNNFSHEYIYAVVYLHTYIHSVLFQHASPNSINMLISMEGVYKNTYKGDNYLQNYYDFTLILLFF